MTRKREFTASHIIPGEPNCQSNLQCLPWHPTDQEPLPQTHPPAETNKSVSNASRYIFRKEHLLVLFMLKILFTKQLFRLWTMICISLLWEYSKKVFTDCKTGWKENLHEEQVFCSWIFLWLWCFCEMACSRNPVPIKLWQFTKKLGSICTSLKISLDNVESIHLSG